MIVKLLDTIFDSNEKLIQMLATFDHFFRKNVFLSIDPEVWEAFLCAVQDFSKVADVFVFALLVKNFVGIAELLTVLPVGCRYLKDGDKPFDTAQERFTGLLAVFRLEVIFLVG